MTRHRGSGVVHPRGEKLPFPRHDLTRPAPFDPVTSHWKSPGYGGQGSGRTTPKEKEKKSTGDGSACWARAKRRHFGSAAAQHEKIPKEREKT